MFEELSAKDGLEQVALGTIEGSSPHIETTQLARKSGLYIRTGRCALYVDTVETC